MKTMTIGVDIGNYDTKTQNCKFPSGYAIYETNPELSNNVLQYNGKYYVPDIRKRIPYVVDKRKDDQALILSLIAMAEEIIHVARRMNPSNIQGEITKVSEVKLGLGLPPGQFNSLASVTSQYFKEKFKNEVIFTYKKFEFRFVVKDIAIYPQDFVAVCQNKASKIATRKRYFICGIGGGTVDIVPIANGMPNGNECVSLEKGTRIMYSAIQSDVQRQTGEMIEEDLIEDVLREEPTVLKDDIKQIIKAGAKKHYTEIINSCNQRGFKFSQYPVVFFGGGALLFEDNINNDSSLAESEVLGDVNANAKAYAYCMSER